MSPPPGGVSPGVAAAVGASSAADVEARVAAELRASRAEMEASTLRQQVWNVSIIRDWAGIK